MTKEQADEVLRIFQWAKDHGAKHVTVADSHVTFADAPPPEETPKLVPPPAVRDPRAWADMQLFGTPMTNGGGT